MAVGPSADGTVLPPIIVWRYRQPDDVMKARSPLSAVTNSDEEIVGHVETVGWGVGRSRNMLNLLLRRGLYVSHLDR